MMIFLNNIIVLPVLFIFTFVQLQGANASDHHHENMTMSSAGHQHTSHTMHGLYGLYPMQREASGTSWQPESTPMEGIHIPYHEGMLMLHGFATGVYDKQGGKRGDEGFYGTSMFMFMAQRDINKKSTVAVRCMFSLEPATILKNGYPLLLQTGETGDGITPLIDRQHPHNFFMELAAVYSFFFSKSYSLFFYAGLPAEPALGPPVFMHRFSGTYFPDAPITHHWLDSTHIANGVITIGFVIKNCKLEGSIFTGREPDQHRWTINRPRFDSYSIRFTINPTKNISVQVSSGWLKSPEQLEPKVNTQRITASVSYNQPLFHERCNWQATGCWGRNVNSPGLTLDGFLLESTVQLWSHSVFGRFEWIAKDELFAASQPLNGKKFNVSKASLGYMYEVTRWGPTSWSAGIEGSVAMFPQQLDPFYGNTPFSFMIFVRVALG